MLFFLIVYIFTYNLVYAKYCEKIKQKYVTKIAEPIFILETDEKKIVEYSDNINSEIYRFSIKNYKENKINSITMYYQFEILGLDENIKYQVWDISKNKNVEIKDGKSSFFCLGIDKKENKYCIIVDLLNSKINKNLNIDLKINTKFLK